MKDYLNFDFERIIESEFEKHYCILEERKGSPFSSEEKEWIKKAFTLGAFAVETHVYQQQQKASKMQIEKLENLTQKKRTWFFKP